jgi:hypothetical protein
VCYFLSIVTDISLSGLCTGVSNGATSQERKAEVSQVSIQYEVAIEKCLRNPVVCILLLTESERERCFGRSWN